MFREHEILSINACADMAIKAEQGKNDLKEAASLSRMWNLLVKRKTPSEKLQLVADAADIVQQENAYETLFGKVVKANLARLAPVGV